MPSHNRFALTSSFALLILTVLISQSAFALDPYKPYLHEPTVPEHPKVKLYGGYSTSLFPGAATYSYPIEVPKGTNDLQPSISLTYNSQSAKQRPGILGAGWSLTQSYVYRDVNSTPDNAADDKFFLILGGSSNELVYDSSDGYYHTKTESFLRVQNMTGGSNAYGLYWLVTSKDGTQYSLGYSTNSELVSNTGRSYALRWSLDRVTDIHGNNIFYSYLEDPNPEDSGSVYLSSIKYDNDQQRSVTFTYESAVRPDRRRVYDQSNLLEESRRLVGIDVSANGNLVRRYTLSYTGLDSENSLTSLSTIKYFGSDGASLLHKVSFDYYVPDTGFTRSATQWVSPASFSSDDNDYGGRLADLNNDGFVDLIQGRSTTSEKKAWLSDRSGNWTQGSQWAPPAYFTEPKTVDKLTKECAWTNGECSSYEWTYCLASKCFKWGGGCGSGVWYYTNQYMGCGNYYLNYYSTVNVDIDTGVKLSDFNNDGFVDIIKSNNAEKKAWAGNGTGWNDVSGTWAPPIDFFVDGKDQGVQVADLNGDGRPDILQSYYGGSGPVKKAYLNNGTGWVDASSTWQAPAYFIYNDADGGARLEDVNGDGLPDIIESQDNGTVVKNVWLNNGAGWTLSSTWTIPVLFIKTGRVDEGVRFADMNGDGLPDMVQAITNSSGTFNYAWINTGSGWARNDSWASPEVFVVNGVNMGKRLADVTGDGLVDIVTAFTNSSGSYYWSWTKNSSTPYMLKKITNELGGTVSLNYQQSTILNNTGNDSLSDLGFNVWVVSNVSTNNSMAGPFNSFGTTSYGYANGSYDYSDFEFRGFAKVNETLPDSNKVVHYFYQDDVLKSKEYRTEVYNSTGSIFSKTESMFNWTGGNYWKVLPVTQTSYLYDGSSSNPNVTNVSFVYDNYGNIVQKNSLGSVDVSGDEKYERFQYTYNTSAWIVGTPYRYQLFDSDNSTKMKEVKYSYDSKCWGCSPSKGDLTEVENLLIPYTGGRHVVRYEYDSFGNVVRVTDPLGRITNYGYGFRDSTYTYPDWTDNALQQRDDYKYDLGTGNLLWEMSNNINHTFYYDVFGRIVKEVQPYDDYFLPTKNYSYSFSGTAPSSIKVSQRTSANKTFDVYYFYDGLGNFIQLKKPADGNQQIVKNFFYDGAGKVVAEQNPYFSSFSTSLGNVSTTENFTNYTYDSLGRVNLIKNPDGTNKTIGFDHKTITAWDENGHRKAYVLDAYDRIINVLEYNNNPVLHWNFETDIYNTSYEYDTSDNLVKITDALGNTYTFTYDSLGRRTALSDPDLGNWTYTYDLAGNLISQKQVGGGNLVTGDGYYREYDSFNQLIRIRNGSTNSSPVIESYTYDPFGQRIKISRNDSANTTIYTPFKELMEIRNSSGVYDYTYVYQDGTLVARVNPDGSRWFYHPDNLGSTSLITDSNGNIVENTYYSPFGEILGGGTADLKLYIGQIKDLTNLYMLGRIQYNPTWALRLSPDPLTQNIYNPQNINHYSYAWNNPYLYKDPSGNCIDPTFVSTAICAGVVGTGIITTGIIADYAGPTIAKLTGQLVDYGSTTIKNFFENTFGSKGINIGEPPSTKDLEQTVQNAGQGITNKVTNPGGSRGGPEHRSTVGETVGDINSRGLGSDTETSIKNPQTGKVRRADAVAIDPNTGKVTEIYQVGKTNQRGDPIARERSALNDIMDAIKYLNNFAENVKITFIDYVSKVKQVIKSG